ncbi:MAG TPA: hypothetical protein VFH36_18430 [Acidimicrobiales bacterium]|nr:hypothetical protein [Acidimicrobiales bacterium]
MVSSDSHPIGGAFTFRVGAARTDAGDDQALIDEVLGGSRDGDTTLGAVFGVVRFAGFAGITVLVGSVAFLAWLWPAGAGDRRAQRLVTGAWATTVVATVLSIPLQGAYAAAGRLGDALGLDVLADELGARTGRAWVVRLLLLAAAAVVLPRLARAAPAIGARASVVGGLALLATVSLTGHAVSGDLAPLAFVTDLVHLSAVSVWLGGLAVLVVALLWRGAVHLYLNEPGGGPFLGFEEVAPTSPCPSATSAPSPWCWSTTGRGTSRPRARRSPSWATGTSR